nr:cellulose synthase-like protein H1 [Tanacetum cinerariifolium]
MASDTLDSSCLPLQEKIVHNNKTARAIELLILALLVSLLVYRFISFKDQDHYLPWLVALLCESWFTFIWVLEVSMKWNQCSTRTYPERLVKRAPFRYFTPESMPSDGDSLEFQQAWKNMK